MENLKIEEDKHVMVCQARSFPDGIMPAFRQLHSLVPDAFQRTTYGLSRPEGSMENIIYKAAVDESYEGEGRELGLDIMVIPAGNYKSIIIKDYRENLLLSGQPLPSSYPFLILIRMVFVWKSIKIITR